MYPYYLNKITYIYTKYTATKCAQQKIFSFVKQICKITITTIYVNEQYNTVCYNSHSIAISDMKLNLLQHTQQLYRLYCSWVLYRYVDTTVIHVKNYKYIIYQSYISYYKATLLYDYITVIDT